MTRRAPNTTPMNKIDRDWVTVDSRGLDPEDAAEQTFVAHRHDGGWLDVAAPDGAGRELARASGRSIDGRFHGLAFDARFRNAA